MARGGRKGRQTKNKEEELDRKIQLVLDGVQGITTNARVELKRILKNQLGTGTVDIKKLEQVIRNKGKHAEILSGLKSRGVIFEVSGLPKKEPLNFQLRPAPGSSTVFAGISATKKNDVGATLGERKFR